LFFIPPRQWQVLLGAINMAAVLCLPLPVREEELKVACGPEVIEVEERLPSPTFGQGSLHELTFAFLCLQPLAPRIWWRIRGLSKTWRQLLDGHTDERRSGCGLLPMLVRSMGPLDTANREVDFAGCVYAAVHFGATGPLRELLRPLASPSWARRPFVRGVARESLIQASVSGEVACCRAVLEAHGPASPLAAVKLPSGSPNSCYLGLADVEMAQREAEEWSLGSPDSELPHSSCAVAELLSAAIASCPKATVVKPPTPAFSAYPSAWDF